MSVGARSMMHRWWTPYAFVLPACAVLGVFVGLSFARSVWYSLTRYTPFQEPEFVGLENYRRLIADDRFWACLFNSGVYLLVTPVLIVLSLWAAMVLRAQIRGERWFRVLLFLPVVTPTIVGSAAWRLVLGEQGLLNAMLGGLGLGPFSFLTSYPLTLVSPMLVTVWKGLGFYMMVFLAALMGVPRELEEAAELDGAGRLGVLRHVVLPTIRPVIVMVAVISSISAMKVFDELYVTVKGVPVEHQTVVPLVYDWAVERGDYGMASAVGMALFVIVLVLSVINLRLTRSRGGASA